MQHSAEMSRCLVACDVRGIRKLWSHIAPQMPQPKNDREALVMIHYARTRSVTIATRLRFYSHRWLTDEGYPSALPDELKPRAERMYPRIVEGVGIACRASSQTLKPVAAAIQTAMSDAVMDAYAEGRKDPVFVKGRMLEAREKTQRYFRDLLMEGTSKVKVISR